MENNDLIGKKSKPIPIKKPEIGIDTEKTLQTNVIDASENNELNVSALESFSNISQTREQVYGLIDTMSQDDTISAILETYAEDATESNDYGKIIWCESSDNNVLKYVTYLLDTLNVDKYAYSWVYNLIKYGDLYIKLYRESDCDDESLLSNKKKDKLDEDVRLKISKNSDHYVNFIEAVANPGEMFELTRLGKTAAFIKAPATVQQNYDSTTSMNYYLNYKMKKKDVEIYEATDFIHASLQDSVSRTKEEVSIYVDDDVEDESNKLVYSVKKGQSLLYNSFKIWRELSLLENSVLLNRITKSAIVRVLSIDTGDMPKEQANNFLERLKEKIEQKSALDVGKSMSEYTNPGPIENIIYVPKNGEKGNISAQTIGGDAVTGDLTDLSYFQNKLYGCLRGSMKVMFSDGTTDTIKHACENKELTIEKYINTCDTNGNITKSKIVDAKKTKNSNKFIKFTMEDDTVIEVTPEHLMMLKDGTYKEAQYITEDDELMSI